jgi:hypothetical protein
MIQPRHSAKEDIEAAVGGTHGEGYVVMVIGDQEVAWNCSSCERGEHTLQSLSLSSEPELRIWDCPVCNWLNDNSRSWHVCCWCVRNW